MLSLLHSSIPSLSPRILTTTPKLTSTFARTFLTSSNRQEAAVPAKRGLLTKAKLEIRLDESLLPPKKPAYAFISFYNDFMKSQTTPKPILETSKEAAKAWQGMSDAEKKVYQDRAANEHAEYRTKYQEWVNSVHPSVIAKINSLRRETGRRMVNNVRSDGINKPLHPYNQFVREFHTKYVEEHGKLSKESFGAYSKLASEAWKNLSEAERNAYRERYKKEKAEYLPKFDKLKLKTASSAPQSGIKKPSTSAAKKNKAANSKTQSAIKKPSSPYSTFKNNFQKKYIKEHGEVSQEVLAQLAKDAWKKLSTGRKNGYKKRYETKIAEYLAERNKDKLS